VQYICPCIFPLSFFGEVKNLSDRKESPFLGDDEKKKKSDQARKEPGATKNYEKSRQNLHGMTATRT